jgi:hypothetical protein
MARAKRLVIMRKLAPFLVVGSLLLLPTLTGCAASASNDDAAAAAQSAARGAKQISAKTSPEYEVVDLVRSVYPVALPGGASARVLDIVGGDGMNAGRIGVAVTSPSGATKIWLLSSMIAQVESVQAKGSDGLVIQTTRDTISEDGESAPKESVEFDVGWTLEDRVPSDTLRVSANGAPAESLEADTNPRMAVLGQLASVHGTYHDTLGFQVGLLGAPGQPSELVLSIGNFYDGAKQFELGLRASRVDEVKGRAPGVIEITSTLESEQGPVTVTHAVRYAKEGEGVASAITLTRGR